MANLKKGIMLIQKPMKVFQGRMYSWMLGVRLSLKIIPLGKKN